MEGRKRPAEKLLKAPTPRKLAPHHLFTRAPPLILMSSPSKTAVDADSLTLTDFLLVAELGRVLLFSWEELELFSSSSSSSSSKLMLLEMPGPRREEEGMNKEKSTLPLKYTTVTYVQTLTHLYPHLRTYS